MIKIKFYFSEIKPANKEELINNILKEIENDKFLGYAGFKKKKYLKWDLSYRWLANFKSENYRALSKKEKNKIENVIKKTIQICRKKLKVNKVYIFIFPWFPGDRDKVFKGVTGYARYEGVINLYLYPKKFNLDSLKQTVIHEYNHLACFFYQKTFRKRGHKWRILDSLVFEGLAQNFEEDILKIRPIYSKALSQKEALNLLKKIENKIYEPLNYKFYKDLFFGSPKFKRWSGYTIGYFIVKEFRKKSKNLKWINLIRFPPENFLNHFLKYKTF
jgi:uncharacterized protein YjaZ